jgi:hypothetical protein
MTNMATVRNVKSDIFFTQSFLKNNEMVLFEARVSVDILLNKQGGILTTQDL